MICSSGPWLCKDCAEPRRRNLRRAYATSCGKQRADPLAPALQTLSIFTDASVALEQPGITRRIRQRVSCRLVRIIKPGISWTAMDAVTALHLKRDRERQLWLVQALRLSVCFRPGHAIDRMTAFQIGGPGADWRKPTHFSRSKSLRTPRVGNSFATS